MNNHQRSCFQKTARVYFFYISIYTIQIRRIIHNCYIFDKLSVRNRLFAHSFRDIRDSANYSSAENRFDLLTVWTRRRDEISREFVCIRKVSQLDESFFRKLFTSWYVLWFICIAHYVPNSARFKDHIWMNITLCFNYQYNFYVLNRTVMIFSKKYLIWCILYSWTNRCIIFLWKYRNASTLTLHFPQCLFRFVVVAKIFLQFFHWWNESICTVIYINNWRARLSFIVLQKISK